MPVHKNTWNPCNVADQMQMILLMKNFAMAGDLLLLAEHGAGAFSLDNRK